MHDTHEYQVKKIEYTKELIHNNYRNRNHFPQSSSSLSSSLSFLSSSSVLTAFSDAFFTPFDAPLTISLSTESPTPSAVDPGRKGAGHGLSSIISQLLLLLCELGVRLFYCFTKYKATIGLLLNFRASMLGNTATKFSQMNELSHLDIPPNVVNTITVAFLIACKLTHVPLA